MDGITLSQPPSHRTSQISSASGATQSLRCLLVRQATPRLVTEVSRSGRTLRHHVLCDALLALAFAVARSNVSSPSGSLQRSDLGLAAHALTVMPQLVSIVA